MNAEEVGAMGGGRDDTESRDECFASSFVRRMRVREQVVRGLTGFFVGFFVYFFPAWSGDFL